MIMLEQEKKKLWQGNSFQEYNKRKTPNSFSLNKAI